MNKKSTPKFAELVKWKGGKCFYLMQSLISRKIYNFCKFFGSEQSVIKILFHLINLRSTYLKKKKKGSGLDLLCSCW